MRINIKKSLFWGGSLLSGIGGNVSGALLLTLNQAPVLVINTESSDSSSDSSDSSDSSSDSSDSSISQCNWDSGSGSKCYVEHEREGYKLKVTVEESLKEKIQKHVKGNENFYKRGYRDYKALVWCLGARKIWFNTDNNRWWFWHTCGNKYGWWNLVDFPDDLEGDDVLNKVTVQNTTTTTS